MNLKTTIVLVMLVSLTWLVGCIDVSSTGPTPPTIESEFRYLNAAADLPSVSISLDLGPAVGSINFGEANAHQTYPSGNRVGVTSPDGDTLRIATTAEQRATVVLLTKETGATRTFKKLIERRIFDPATQSPADSIIVPINDGAGVHVADTTFKNVISASYRVVNAVPGSDYTLRVDGGQTPIDGGLFLDRNFAGVSLAFNPDSEANYGFRLLPGDYSVTVTSTATGAVLATTQVTVSDRRQTSVVVSDGTTVSIMNIEDN